MPQTITNIPRCLPQILTVPKFWYHLAHSFSRKNVPFDFERAFWEAEGALSKPKGPFSRENEAQEMTPKLLALAKVCSVLGNIRDVSWHLSKRESELEKRWTFSILDKNGAHKNKAWHLEDPTAWPCCMPRRPAPAGRLRRRRVKRRLLRRPCTCGQRPDPRPKAPVPPQCLKENCFHYFLFWMIL